jgi:hypothetical protein
VDAQQRFGGKYFLHPQNRRVKQASNQNEVGGKQDPEDGAFTSLPKVHELLRGLQGVTFQETILFKIKRVWKIKLTEFILPYTL